MKTPVCPICNSFKNSLLFSLSSQQAASHLFPDNAKKASEIMNVIELIWEGNKVDFLECGNCSFGYANPFRAGTSELYSSLYYSNFDYPIQKWEYQQTLQILKSIPMINLETTLLEIGAGNGSFLNNLINHNLIKKENVYATEYSDAAVSAIQANGFNCTNKNIFQLKDLGELPGFNIICMFQVLEHLDNLSAVFESLDSLSASGADLFIAVPNSKLRNFLDKHHVLYDIPPVHVGKYAIQSFEFIGQKYNWKIISHAVEPMKWKNKIRKFLIERYWKNQLAIEIEKSGNFLFKRGTRYVLMFLLVLRYFIVILNLNRKDFGTSFWIHLKKKV